MTDEDAFCARLASAKYYVENSENPSDAAAALGKPRSARPVDNALGWLSALVGVAMLVGIGFVAWSHRDSLASSASTARKKSSNPIDFMLWVCGSDKTFNDALMESQRKTAAQFEEFRPAYFGADFNAAQFKFDASKPWPQAKPMTSSASTRSR